MKAFAPGDLISMKANYGSTPQTKIPNGAIKKIETIKEDGTIHLVGGRSLDRNFRHFVHGYAATSFSSQGKDRTFVIVSADGKALNSLSQNQAYVSFSRGIEGISVYTDDLKKFKQAILRSSHRTLAVEKLAEGILKAKLGLLLGRAEKNDSSRPGLCKETF